MMQLIGVIPRSHLEHRIYFDAKTLLTWPAIYVPGTCDQPCLSCSTASSSALAPKKYYFGKPVLRFSGETYETCHGTAWWVTRTRCCLAFTFFWHHDIITDGRASATDSSGRSMPYVWSWSGAHAYLLQYSQYSSCSWCIVPGVLYY